MDYKPYSSFTSASLAANFPALKILLHADDYTTGALTWASRKGGLTLTLAAAATKDTKGVYTTVTNSVSSISGTMPTLSKYAVAIGIGELRDASATLGCTVTFGGVAVGPSVSSAGVCYDNGASALNTAPTLTGTITAGSKVCTGAYFDLVDTTSPQIFRVLASGLSTDTAIPNGSDTTTATTQIVLGAALERAMTIFSFTAGDNGARMKVMALFDFGESVTLSDLELACAEMARTQELFVGWRNRAAA